MRERKMGNKMGEEATWKTANAESEARADTHLH